MRFCSLNFQNLVRKIDLVNRRWVFYSRAYGKFRYMSAKKDHDITTNKAIQDHAVSLKTRPLMPSCLSRIVKEHF